MVQPHVYNDSLSDEQNKFVDRLLIRFFKNEVKWKPNDTLMKSDMIEFMWKYIDIDYEEKQTYPLFGIRNWPV